MGEIAKVNDSSDRGAASEPSRDPYNEVRRETFLQQSGSTQSSLSANNKLEESSKSSKPSWLLPGVMPEFERPEKPSEKPAVLRVANDGIHLDFKPDSSLFPTLSLDTKIPSANPGTQLFPPLNPAWPPANPGVLPQLKPESQSLPQIKPGELQPDLSWLSALKPDSPWAPAAKPDAPLRPEPLPGVTRNGNSLHIDYPGGMKTRDIVFDESGKAREITTRDEIGSIQHLVRKGDQWVVAIQGLEIPVPGKVEANDRGEVMFETEPGRIRREKPDGTSVQERQQDVPAVRPVIDAPSNIQLDAQHRIKSINYGNINREFEYFDNSSELKKATTVDAEKHSTSSLTRDYPGSNQWKTESGRSLTGDIKVTPEGGYTFKLNAGSGIGDDGRWTTIWSDGSTTRDVVNNDGSRLGYENGKLRKIVTGDGVSADVSDNRIVINNPRTGEKTTWSSRLLRWTSDSPKFPGAKTDLQINERCEISFTAEDGSKHLVRPDGKEAAVVSRRDGVQLVLNDQRQIDCITKGDSVRTIQRGPDGSIVRVMDKSKGSERVVLDRAQNDGIASVEMNNNGDLMIRRQDNVTRLERADFSSITNDADGSPLQITNQRGDSRSFRWSGFGTEKQVTDIQETRRTPQGDLTELWSRKPGTNDFVSTDRSGQQRTRQQVQVLRDGSGDYVYKNDGRDVLARLGADNSPDSRPDATPDRPPISSGIDAARQNLLDVMKEKLADVNFKRLQEMMQKFEVRMSERAELRKLAGVKSADFIDAEVQREIQGTYDNLREMVVKGDDNTFYDQKTRVKLAENFMFHAMEPTTIEQGPASSGDDKGHGTCWITTGEIWGMTQHPGAMADYLKQISLDGKVVTKNGGEGNSRPKTYSFSRGLLSFDGKKQESKWSIQDATTMWRETPGMKMQIIGDRSPVNKIFQYTLPMLSGSRREGDVDGGMYETANIVGQGHTRGVREIMLMVTGDTPVDMKGPGHPQSHLLRNNFAQTMAEKGTVLNYPDAGHLTSQTVRKVDNKWYLIQDDQHGEAEDKVLSQITDIARWAKGDRSVEQPVHMTALSLLHRKKYIGSGNADRIGTVTPRQINR